jgi:hypothetical protein
MAGLAMRFGAQWLAGWVAGWGLEKWRPTSWRMEGMFVRMGGVMNVLASDEYGSNVQTV